MNINNTPWIFMPLFECKSKQFFYVFIRNTNTTMRAVGIFFRVIIYKPTKHPLWHWWSHKTKW